MEIMYVLHIIPSNYKDMEISGKKQQQQCLILAFDSPVDVPFLSSIVVFFPFLNCPSDVLSCFLSLHGDNRRRCR